MVFAGRSEPRSLFRTRGQVMKAFGAMFAGGLLSFFVLKLLASVMAPAVGVLFGFLALAFKVGLFLLVAFLVYRMFRRRRDETVA